VKRRYSSLEVTSIGNTVILYQQKEAKPILYNPLLSRKNSYDAANINPAIRKDANPASIISSFRNNLLNSRIATLEYRLD
jgi:hypothetical protein